MSSRHYDIVVLGRSLGTLATAALLARRDFSVLLLGQGQRPASYDFEGVTLKRRVFSLLFGASPVWTRILQDLAQSQTFKRRLTPLEPMFGVASPDRRVAISSQPDLFESEIRREFPEVRQLVDELYARLADANAAIDNAFARDAIWPATTFMEKMEASRVSGALPFRDSGPASDILSKFPVDHPYREIGSIPAVFGSDLDFSLMGLSPVAFARLSGSWSRGLSTLKGGEDELEQFLLERFEAHGGVCHLSRSAEQLLVEGGRVCGIQSDSSDDRIGTNAVVSSLSGEALAELAGGQGVTKKARNGWPQLTPTRGRFVVSMVVKSQGVPAPVGHETFLLPPESTTPDPRTPVVHLQRYDNATLGPNADPTNTLLTAEALLPAEGALTLSEARLAIVNVVKQHLPFIEQHLQIVDSPHDGLPLEDYRTGERREIDRIHVKGTHSSPEFMEYQWTVDPVGPLGLAGEPVRGPVPGTYLVGRTTLPALGQEGELISAWSVAKILTRKDSTRQRQRRQLWTKIET